MRNGLYIFTICKLFPTRSLRIGVRRKRITHFVMRLEIKTVMLLGLSNTTAHGPTALRLSVSTSDLNQKRRYSGSCFIGTS